MAGTYGQFLSALGQNESGNNYAFVSSLGYLGRFQFGEEALQVIGFYAGNDGTGTIDFIGGWTAQAASHGVTDKAGFLASSAAQDAAADAWFAKVWADLTDLSLQTYVGQTVGGVAITPSGLIAGAHLVGVWALKDFLSSGGGLVMRDGYGTPVSEYVDRFGGFDTPFAPGGGGGGGGGGGSGAETLVGGSGFDQLHGQSGNDVISGGDGFDDLHGRLGDDVVRGGGGDDWVVGGQGADALFGEEGGDLVLGNLGNDTLDAGWGDDQVRGGQGDDLITGGGGADFVSGDRGADTLAGGAGADLFHVFAEAGTDRVVDFSYGEGDRVDVLGDWSVSQAGADTVIQVGGATMTLVGVQLWTLPGDWIV